MRVHIVIIDEFKVDYYWMKLKTPIFEAKLSLNLTTKKIISHQKDSRQRSWELFKISTKLTDISWDEQPDLRGYIGANKILSLLLEIWHILNEYGWLKLFIIDV